MSLWKIVRVIYGPEPILSSSHYLTSPSHSIFTIASKLHGPEESEMTRKSPRINRLTSGSLFWVVIYISNRALFLRGRLRGSLRRWQTWIKPIMPSLRDSRVLTLQHSNVVLCVAGQSQIERATTIIRCDRYISMEWPRKPKKCDFSEARAPPTDWWTNTKRLCPIFNQEIHQPVNDRNTCDPTESRLLSIVGT